MQISCGKLRKLAQLPNQPEISNRTIPDSTPTSMANILNRVNDEFLKGAMFGAMAGMVVAAYTYSIVDREHKVLKGAEKTSPVIRPKPIAHEPAVTVKIL